MRIVAFHTPKPKPFNYRPRYYDEKKERLENLKKKYESEGSNNGVSPDFRDRLRSSWKIKEKRIGNISKVTLLVYAALVAFIMYYIFLS